MFVDHLPELLIVLVLAMIFVGPGKLPVLGGALGKTIAQFRQATREIDENLSAPLAAPAARPRRVLREQHYISGDEDKEALRHQQ